MVIIVWRGWGIIVPGIWFAALMLSAVIQGAVGSGTYLAYRGLIAAVVAVVCGFAIWFIAKAIESRPGRIFIDKATGREIKVGANAGSFFFVPTRYWAFITVGLGLVAGVALISGWNGRL